MLLCKKEKPFKGSTWFTLVHIKLVFPCAFYPSCRVVSLNILLLVLRLKVFRCLRELCIWFHLTQSAFLFSFFLKKKKKKNSCRDLMVTLVNRLHWHLENILHIHHMLWLEAVWQVLFVCVCVCVCVCMSVHVIWVFAHVLSDRNTNTETTPVIQCWEYLKSHFNEHFYTTLACFFCFVFCLRNTLPKALKQINKIHAMVWHGFCAIKGGKSYVS